MLHDRFIVILTGHLDGTFRQLIFISNFSFAKCLTKEIIKLFYERKFPSARRRIVTFNCLGGIVIRNTSMKKNDRSSHVVKPIFESKITAPGISGVPTSAS